MSLCLAAGGAVAKIAVATFVLGWTHTVEKVRWEEVWRVEGSRLVMVEARVQGSGAGMDPPAGSRLEGRFWRWRPAVAPLAELKLARSQAGGDWELCFGRSGCSPIGTWLPAADGEIVLSACP